MPAKPRRLKLWPLAFERDQIRIPNDPVLLGELQAFEATRLQSGMMRYAAPNGLHDDTVMALAMAWAGISGQIRCVVPRIRLFTQPWED
jgi:hypothetical protein